MTSEPTIRIAERKLTRYLLVFRGKDDKSAHRQLAGCIIDNWPVPECDLLALANSQEATPDGEDGHEPSCSVTGE